MSWGIEFKHTKPEGTMWPQDYLDTPSVSSDPDFELIRQGRREYEVKFRDNPDSTKTRNRWRYVDDNPNVRYLEWSLPQFGILSGLEFPRDIKKIRMVFDIMKSQLESLPFRDESGRPVPLDQNVSVNFLGETVTTDPMLAAPSKQFRKWYVKYLEENGQTVEMTGVKNFNF